MSTLDQVMIDLFPLPGTRIKQWVIDVRREREWDLATCPKLAVGAHLDNTGAPCRSSDGNIPWCDLDDHDCCETCNSIAYQAATIAAVDEWCFEKRKRPDPQRTDRSVFSDEVAP